MNEKITVMLSSTVSDMLLEREATVRALKQFEFVKFVGTKPIRIGTHPSSPYIQTLNLAETCDFLILLLGERFGFEIREGVSATEAEFDAAYKNNPTKILVFKKGGIEPEEQQKRFISKVSDYYKGYWITNFRDLHDLQELVVNSFLFILKERASIGYRLNYFDHFVRIAIQRRPIPDIKVRYSVQDDFIELIYDIFGNIYVVHFQKTKLYNDFWGCVAELEKLFMEWMK